jgi:chromosome partitioning protein
MHKGTRIIAVANSKGGSGKTATVFNLGSELARSKKVLLWDMDPQASLTNSFQVNFSQNQIYSEDILATDKIDPTSAPVKVGENLYLIPTVSQALGGLESMLQAKDNVKRAKIITQKLAHLEFDFIIIDPPGAADIFMSTALVAAQEVIIPVRPTHNDFSVMVEFKEAIEKIKPLNPEIEVKGILFNQVISSSKNYSIYRKFLEEANWDKLVCKSSIRMATSIANAPGVGKDVIAFDPKSKAAEDYQKFAKEVLSWN